MITEKTLRKWRKDSLSKVNHPLIITDADGQGLNIAVLLEQELHQRIIRLTQDLLDVHLMKGK